MTTGEDIVVVAGVLGVHHGAGGGYLGVGGDRRHQAGSWNTFWLGNSQQAGGGGLTQDKCKSGRHGDGEDYEEDGHSSPWSWTTSEIFGEILEASSPPSALPAWLDGAEAGEAGAGAGQSTRHGLQLGGTPGEHSSL